MKNSRIKGIGSKLSDEEISFLVETGERWDSVMSVTNYSEPSGEWKRKILIKGVGTKRGGDKMHETGDWNVLLSVPRCHSVSSCC